MKNKLNIKPQVIEDTVIGLTITIFVNDDGSAGIHIDRHEKFLANNRDYAFDKNGEIWDQGSWIE